MGVDIKSDESVQEEINELLDEVEMKNATKDENAELSDDNPEWRTMAKTTPNISFLEASR